MQDTEALVIAEYISEDSSIVHNRSDLRQFAIAVNATSDTTLQSAIDSIKSRDIKYWAIIATAKTSEAKLAASHEIDNDRVDQLAYIMSSREDAKALGSVGHIHNPDFKNLALAYLTDSSANKYIDSIKARTLKNLALSITAKTVEDKLKYANAILE